MKKLLLVLPVIVVVMLFGVTKVFACGGWFEASCGSDVQQVADNQTRLVQAVPIPVLKTSLERKNIKRRLELFSDEAKVSYIYLTSYGRVMAFYTVKGKITSGQKRLTSNQQISNGCGGLLSPGDNPCTGSLIVDSPELDGTYGSSSPYIFFWTTDGTYVQWSGEYMLADQPLKLTTQPELVRDIK